MFTLRLPPPDPKFKADFVERGNLFWDEDEGTEKE